MQATRHELCGLNTVRVLSGHEQCACCDIHSGSGEVCGGGGQVGDDDEIFVLRQPLCSRSRVSEQQWRHGRARWLTGTWGCRTHFCASERVAG